MAAADATFHSTDAAVVASFTDADLPRTVAGGLLTVVGLLLLLPFVAMRPCGTPRRGRRTSR